MHWDRLFEDLEGQLSAQWEAERAALEAESERLRIAALEVRTRLRRLLALGASVRLLLRDRGSSVVRLQAVGADWVGAEEIEGTAMLLVPLRALTSIETDQGMLQLSLIEAEETSVRDALRERMTLGFVLRDLARRRTPVRVALAAGTTLHGTIDRAGADHLDLAVHEAGEPRRAAAVQAYRIIPFEALAWVSSSRLAGKYS